MNVLSVKLNLIQKKIMLASAPSSCRVWWSTSLWSMFHRKRSYYVQVFVFGSMKFLYPCSFWGLRYTSSGALVAGATAGSLGPVCCGSSLRSCSISSCLNVNWSKRASWQCRLFGMLQTMLIIKLFTTAISVQWKNCIFHQHTHFIRTL